MGPAGGDRQPPHARDGQGGRGASASAPLPFGGHSGARRVSSSDPARASPSLHPMSPRMPFRPVTIRLALSCPHRPGGGKAPSHCWSGAFRWEGPLLTRWEGSLRLLIWKGSCWSGNALTGKAPSPHWSLSDKGETNGHAESHALCTRAR